METVLKTRIIKIGNSQGVRIPKAWLEQLALGSEVEMLVQHGQLVIRSARRTRQGWKSVYEKMAAYGDDRLLDEDIPVAWDFDEWEW